jgi:hypothetical protein
MLSSAEQRERTVLAPKRVSSVWRPAPRIRQTQVRVPSALGLLAASPHCRNPSRSEQSCGAGPRCRWGRHPQLSAGPCPSDRETGRSRPEGKHDRASCRSSAGGSRYAARTNRGSPGGRENTVDATSATVANQESQVPEKQKRAGCRPRSAIRLAHLPGEAAVPPSGARLLSAWQGSRLASARETSASLRMPAGWTGSAAIASAMAPTGRGPVS